MNQCMISERVDALREPSQEASFYQEMLDIRDRCDSARIRQGVDRLSRRFGSRKEAIAGALQTLHDLRQLIDPAFHLLTSDAGHAEGHRARDAMHAVFLAKDGEVSHGDAFLTVIGGTLHDLGTGVVPRYDERNLAVRHAEVGALLVHHLLKAAGEGDYVADLAAYAIAAHTHYGKESEVTCRDGAVRKVTPYRDCYEDGSPMRFVWGTRQADRLDCSGALFVGRHILTLERDHHDFTHGAFHEVKFGETWRLELLSPEDRKRAGNAPTMLEHFRMFASSQSNTSVYGRHDTAWMASLRDLYKQYLEQIIAATLKSPSSMRESSIGEFFAFLGEVVEPSAIGRAAAQDLEERFRLLPLDVQSAWSNGFAEALVAADLQGRRLRESLMAEWSLLQGGVFGGYVDKAIRMPQI